MLEIKELSWQPVRALDSQGANFKWKLTKNSKRFSITVSNK